ncbi:MAG: hypothetical protein IIW08_05465 [Clostridia bacterium]|nr:hypothetical protein [Clostridia bacterium]
MKLYTQDKLRALKKRAKALSLFLILLMALSLTAAVVMCFFVKTANAPKLLLAIITLMTLSGWTAILVLNLACLPSIRESAHMDHILKEETFSHEGVFFVSGMVFRIPKSIEIRKVTLKSEDGETVLSVNSKYASLLPADGTRVRVQAAKGYITQWEAIG